MDKSSFNLTVEDILNKVFPADVKGYDSDQVDAFLDLIISDYRQFDRSYQANQEYIVTLETQNRRIREELQKSEQERARLKTRFEGLKDTDQPNTGNIDLLNRIGKLEAEIFRLGGNPRNIK